MDVSTSHCRTDKLAQVKPLQSHQCSSARLRFKQSTTRPLMLLEAPQPSLLVLHRLTITPQTASPGSHRLARGTALGTRRGRTLPRRSTELQRWSDLRVGSVAATSMEIVAVASHLVALPRLVKLRAQPILLQALLLPAALEAADLCQPGPPTQPKSGPPQG